MPGASQSGDLNNIGKKAIAYMHPVYLALAKEWRKLADVREGIGGFLDGSYLVAHPREWEDFTAVSPKIPTKKLKARRALACYDNVASTIIDAKKSALFREQPLRSVNGGKNEKPTAFEDWLENVDGKGCGIDQFINTAWDPAGTFGHAIVYMDRPAKQPLAEGEVATAAENQQPFLRLYTPLDVADWIEDDYGQLTMIKLLEAIPRTGFEDMSSQNLFRYRVVTTEFWALYDKSGKLEAGGPENGRHEFGTLPVAYLFGKRRALVPWVGQSVLDNSQHYIDLYNLVSEVRELLRNQTFGILNVPLGSGDQAQDLQGAIDMMGKAEGTQNVMFTAQPANYLSPDGTNVTVYHAEIERRLRMIYRLAGIQWEADSKDAEAKGSLVLKREDMNTRLAGYADECELTEYRLAELWYRAMYGADAGQQRFDDDEVTIHYPDTFDVTPFMEVLQQAESAIAMNFPPVVLKELRKALLPKYLPNLTTAQIGELNDAIDNAPDDMTPAEQMKAKIQATVDALGTGQKGVKVPGTSGTGQGAEAA